MENVTPAGTKVPRDVTASAFRNASYQRATHESLMGDSVANQSPTDDTTVIQDAAATVTVNSDLDNNKLTENSKVRQQQKLFLYFHRITAQTV